MRLRPDLDAVVTQVSRTTGLVREDDRSGDVRLAGRLATGREAQVSIQVGPGVVELEVEAATAPDLTVTSETFTAALESELGALRRDPVRFSIEQIFSRGAGELRCRKGRLTALFPESALLAPDYEWMLSALDGTARILERRKVAVRVLGGERGALLDPSGNTRCPYCHGGITGAELDLVACEECATVLHEGCWEEHQGCPLLGCTGKQAERARDRA